MGEVVHLSAGVHPMGSEGTYNKCRGYVQWVQGVLLMSAAGTSNG